MSIQLNLGLYLLNSFIIYELIYSIIHRSKYKFLSLKLITLILLGIHIGGYLYTKDPNHFEVFEVSRRATEADIKKNYKVMLRKFHPDKNSDDPLAHEKFINIKRINEELSNPFKRKMYDKYGASEIREEAEEMEFMALSISKGVLIYFISLIFGIILTYKSKARILCFLLPFLFGGIEMALYKLEFKDFSDYLMPSLSQFDKVSLLRILIGPITCLLRLWFNVFDTSNDENLIRYLESGVNLQNKFAGMNKKPNPNVLIPLVDEFTSISSIVETQISKKFVKQLEEKQIGWFKNMLYWLLILSVQSSVSNLILEVTNLGK